MLTHKKNDVINVNKQQQACASGRQQGSCEPHLHCNQLVAFLLKALENIHDLDTTACTYDEATYQV